ncbi:MAG: glycosyltransferase [Planctomycetota bacterium]|nr:glycosyltransferase [Planctomycetota bacterium]
MINPLVRWPGVSADPQGQGGPVVYEMSRPRALKIKPWRRMKPDVVLLQSWFNTPRDQVESIIADVRQTRPEAKIVFLDWYAPIHLPQPWLFPLVDVYVKKHVVRDRDRYVQGFHDTNLIEYESQWDESLKPQLEEGVPAQALESKLFVGWNFATDRHLVAKLNQRRYESTSRTIEVHCRLGALHGTPWYRHMRERSLKAVSALDHQPSIVTSEGVDPARFWDELCQSKACISPFGYGEVCWRDFEAIAAGAILIKPDMSHLETWPNIYQPYQTYVPVKWDFSDLEEQCAWALASEERRLQICARAVEVWRDYIDRGWTNRLRELNDCLEAASRME